MKSAVIKRLLQLPERSFFLFGPRGTGKSTWLREVLPDALYLDLLDSSLSLELARDPHTLAALVGNRPEKAWIVLDEIQKIPALLDEVQRLMGDRGLRFALCGSSARKLRRAGTNMLAGRALSLSMEPFSFGELGNAFDFKSSLEWGMLPFVQLDRQNATGILSAYVSMYLKEEIREEGLIRKMPPFLRFLGIAGLMNGQTVNLQNIARDAAVPRATVDGYFAIIVDTLIANFLPAYQPGVKVREAAHPKFYWFDAGVARAASGLLFEPADRAWLGTALETLVFHELRVHNATAGKHRPIGYYRTAAGTEIDFVIETRKRRTDAPARVVCVEVKLAEKWDRKWERAMRELKSCSGICVDRMVGVYTGARVYQYDDVSVLPAAEFFAQLHRGEVF